MFGEITIGKDTIIGENVKFYNYNHKYDNLDDKISNQGFNIGKINIGRNCWIALDVVILKDVVIGDNVVIGEGCIIYKSIPSNIVVKNNQSLIFSNKT
ncbi:acetyltransferase-like isoleucine patch superfamily enzyme [Clostridium moniliforme]|uniref:Acetyltransferase-like isoleucine patch superfamily enzyme n=1 Tax=Clostridium moniliforme TaxID=39489 RepID=A0ABS4EYS0_9CLOT|nr:hypothetical protein [Clostridium moniliforme]MBP1889147.1 acetyltransferase-like isoleucine patch superfamily enzyme [Clostridium moniliforme]